MSMTEVDGFVKPPQLNVLALQRELEQIVIKVNYHFTSGFDRHVNLQTPESIFLNFLKKMITLVPTQFLHRINKSDFHLTMSSGYVTSLSFEHKSSRYDWDKLDGKIGSLREAAKGIDFADLASKSHTLDKFYQQADKLVNEIKDFSFK